MLSAEALVQPLAYEREMDAATFLGALDREPSETEQLATAYYLQYRTSQLIGGIAVTGTQVAENVEKMIENVKDERFLHRVVDDYQTAKKPQISPMTKLLANKLEKRGQPGVAQVLKNAILFSPVAFAIDFEGNAIILGDPLSERIIASVGGALLAGYLTALHSHRHESRHGAPADSNSPAL